MTRLLPENHQTWSGYQREDGPARNSVRPIVAETEIETGRYGEGMSGKEKSHAKSISNAYGRLSQADLVSLL